MEERNAFRPSFQSVLDLPAALLTLLFNLSTQRKMFSLPLLALSLLTTQAIAQSSESPVPLPNYTWLGGLQRPTKIYSSQATATAAPAIQWDGYSLDPPVSSQTDIEDEQDTSYWVCILDRKEDPDCCMEDGLVKKRYDDFGQNVIWSCEVENRCAFTPMYPYFSQSMLDAGIPYRRKDPVREPGRYIKYETRLKQVPLEATEEVPWELDVVVEHYDTIVYHCFWIGVPNEFANATAIRALPYVYSVQRMVV
ncbi:hypothetical protein BJ508DRAFT_357519 [Ascobolus immersus RN42]|uniref:Uncharacterized protein n=1 Tax=Ascobolus immersus RN42 TaxID=1160509 RepID=A0A3N4ILQ1_ASCIM|nr:hypothetical protein BJ508DRAFT_357519 [Ascobolus immersus RN42]